jgi:cytoskeletal protein CcmA (bactofilin family)
MQESNANQAKTVVELDTSLKGALVSKCPIVVRGKIEGEVTAPSLCVSASGAVHGVVKVGEIESEGELSGEFEADLVRLSGVVKDKTVVRARSLEVKIASPDGKVEVLLGECAFEVGDMPDKEAAIRAALEQGQPRASAAPAASESETAVPEPKPSQEPPPAKGRKRNSTVPPPAP